MSVLSSSVPSEMMFSFQWHYSLAEFSTEKTRHSEYRSLFCNSIIFVHIIRLTAAPIIVILMYAVAKRKENLTFLIVSVFRGAVIRYCALRDLKIFGPLAAAHVGSKEVVL